MSACRERERIYVWHRSAVLKENKMEKTIKMDFKEYDNLLQELKELRQENNMLKEGKLIYEESNKTQFMFEHKRVYGDEASKKTVQCLIDRIEQQQAYEADLFNKYENLKNSIPEKIRKRYNIK